MDLAPSDEQDALVASFRQLLSKGSTPDVVRDAEPRGLDGELWSSLQETGALAMAVPVDAGGWGASLVDLALVAEELGAAAAPAPVIETQVAARLLAASGAADAAARLEPVLAGTSLLTIALHPPVAGTLRLVPAGAVADHVVYLEGDELRLATVDTADRTAVANLADAPLADITLAGSTLLASGADAVETFQRAIDEWLTLTSAALVGLSRSATRIASEYATERIAFGVPIGTFQGMSHPLADAATAEDGGRLISLKAAWALDHDDVRARELATMAFAFTSRSSQQATYHALHVLGGYGFMLEYDTQLYYRRARGWPRVWGDAEAADLRVADARYGRVTP